MSEVMQRLKQGTSDLHQAAEQSPFQQRMVEGRLSLDEYGAWLGQMYLAHEALEQPLAAFAESDRRFAAVQPHQFQLPHLIADLDTLGLDADGIKALPATATLCSRIARNVEDDPLRLLGYHYVLEGSNNGNRFISRRLLPALGLSGDNGGRYLDPYGEEQRELWQAFRADMDEIQFSDDEIDSLVGAARSMFRAITDISNQLPSA